MRAWWCSKTCFSASTICTFTLQDSLQICRYFLNHSKVYPLKPHSFYLPVSKYLEHSSVYFAFHHIFVLKFIYVKKSTNTLFDLHLHMLLRCESTCWVVYIPQLAASFSNFHRSLYLMLILREDVAQCSQHN